ncbi:PIR protein [Plasmodium ovale]|uniref:PIR Superfamily Protein n=2 Tax=Plasmodium ovale TaxID=36330 RepID=A0A1A8WLQ0_PLAOA|nr:PIR Superfamily Protein [Plasmodium ovale curtisi]SBT83881.1 PIR protein [Plasmodium ovale]
MATSDTNNCELSSDKYYSMLDVVTAEKNSDENLPNMCYSLKEFSWKLEANLKQLKEENKYTDLKKHCTYLNLWLQDHVINTVESKNTIICIASLYSVWSNISNTLQDSTKEECVINFPQVGTIYLRKLKKMYDYINNFEDLKNVFNTKENCKQKYCKDIADVINIHNEFQHVCTGRNEVRCPKYWKDFEKNYSIASEIETKCKGIYDELGLYKVKMYFGEQGIEEYIEQYESEYTFSFFEKLIGYSIKYYLSKTIHYSKYIVLPIILILLFYFFMKKLSFFGSKISPRVDGMRKMWINVQGVTNPATLLNPMKPPGGGNKIGLPYMPK